MAREYVVEAVFFKFIGRFQEFIGKGISKVQSDVDGNQYTSYTYQEKTEHVEIGGFEPASQRFFIHPIFQTKMDQAPQCSECKCFLRDDPEIKYYDGFQATKRDTTGMSTQVLLCNKCVGFYLRRKILTDVRPNIDSYCQINVSRET